MSITKRVLAVLLALALPWCASIGLLKARNLITQATILGTPPVQSQPGVQAVRMNGLMSTLGVAAHFLEYGNKASIVSDAQFINLRKWRDDMDLQGNASFLAIWTNLFNIGVSFIGEIPLVTPPTNSVIATPVGMAQTIAGIGPGALFALEGPNEPANFPFEFNNLNSGTTWQAVYLWQSQYYTAIKNAAGLGSAMPVWTPSLVGEAPDNWGIQFGLSIPAGGGGSNGAGGTVFADALNEHIYPMFQGTKRAQYLDPTAGDVFSGQMIGDFVTTYLHGFAGYPNLATAAAKPKGITETGLPDGSGSIPIGANGSAVNPAVAGKDLLNGWLDSWTEGYQAFCIYTFYETGDGFSIFNGPGSPKTQATYIHNFTTPLVDTGATANTFSPGKLNYSISGMPPGGLSQLFQKSNGTFELVLWTNATNWNAGTGAPITVNPTTVTVSFQQSQPTINIYDPTVKATPQSTLNNALTATVGLSDYPIIVEVNASSCPFGGAGYPDGCVASSAGTPQFPSLFAGYPVRPPWDVVGVDYHAGLPAGASLIAPATAAVPAGCTINQAAFNINCSSGTSVFNGWDFSLNGGWQLVCSGTANVSVTNSNFVRGSNSQDMLVMTPSCVSLSVMYSNLDAQALPSNSNANISAAGVTGAGTLTVEYNTIQNAALDYIDVGPTTEVIKYNLFTGKGASSANADWFQTATGAYNITWDFNTVNELPVVAAAPTTIGFPAGTTPSISQTVGAGFLNASGGVSSGGAALSAAANINSIAAYFSVGGGQFIVGIYDSTGAGGTPGALLAQIPVTTAAVGWNTVNTTSSPVLQPGTYWFIIADNTNTDSLGQAVGTAGHLYVGGQTFALPATAPTFPNTATQALAIYANVTPVAAPPSPPSLVAAPTISPPAPDSAHPAMVNNGTWNNCASCTFTYQWNVAGLPLSFTGGTVLGPIETNINGTTEPLVWPPWNPSSLRMVDTFGGVPTDPILGNFSYLQGVPEWSQVNTASGTFDWSLFDLVWPKIISQGVKDVLMSFQSIPQWVQVGNAYSFAGATITSASPAVVTAAGNQYQNGWRVFFTGGTVPTGLSLGTASSFPPGKYYYVRDVGLDGAGKFRLALTSGGAAINTTGSAGTSTVTAADTPPASMATLTTWVTSYLTRATADGLSVKFVEGINEPNNGPGFFVGSQSDLVAMQQAIFNAAKAYDPTIVVLSPPINGAGNGNYLAAFFTAGGSAYTDIAAFHGYPGDIPTNSQTAYQTNVNSFIAASQGKPVWNTEYSAINGIPASDETWLASTTFIDWAAGVKRKYYYSYDAAADQLWGPPSNGVPGVLNVAGVAQQSLVSWLTGASPNVQLALNGVVWSEDIVQANGTHARAVWTSDGSAPSYPVPSFATQYLTLAGGTVTGLGASVNLSGLPILFQSAPGALPTGSPIATATASSFTPGMGNIGNQLTATVTATNSSGSTSVTTTPTSAVIPGSTVVAPPSCPSGWTAIANGFCQQLIASSQTWTSPANWNNGNNTVEGIGAGSAAAGNFFGSGGGEYCKITNFVVATPGTTTVAVTIGTDANGAQGTNTTWGSALLAHAGTAGGVAAGGLGGTGGTGTCNHGGNANVAASGQGFPGGGGAGGPNGVGGNAGGNTSSGGGGGGGNGGGTAGGSSTTTVGGAGGNNSSGTGGGVAPSGNGTNGGGGAGGNGAGGTPGGNGGNGVEWPGVSAGSGGGGGGPSAGNQLSGNGGLYGGGAGSVGTTAPSLPHGGQGAVIVTYHP